ncbi:MAG: hypothetical protein KAI53_04430, partial [Candidatus Aenigmarchaeota archaeon]|nr:hypothetical protein [Candidatus Aenigmarchaeota archaeon]
KDNWFFQKTYYHASIPAIQIEPKVFVTDENFCYAGSHLWQDVTKGVVTLVSVVVSVGSFGSGAVIAGPLAVVINHEIGQTEYWPNH